MTASPSSTNHQTVELLQTGFQMEMETVINYLANSVHLDGIRAAEIKRSLSEDINEELAHAAKLAKRIKQLGGRVPGSLELQFSQSTLTPPEQSTDLAAVVQGVLDAENSAIDHYHRIIKHAENVDDPVTADLATQLLADEQEHRSQFEGFLAELELAAF